MASLLCSYFLLPPAVSLKKVVVKPSKNSSFFESFIEGISSNLYIPAEAVKYKHWVDLAQNSLRDLATSFDAQIDDEKMEKN
ncbi:predicted protein [Arabidopsis lyrata subsp. lyrata]|uniref:Predicted protein n=1 Tax=Arabidopsis lyrata subsp. lyrata TaxID=81972 RepID=D7MW19_ARALL|nr:predicted protein [Arabidopsis lyrata subsp. lyrata]